MDNWHFSIWNERLLWKNKSKIFASSTILCKMHHLLLYRSVAAFPFKSKSDSCPTLFPVQVPLTYIWGDFLSRDIILQKMTKLGFCNRDNFLPCKKIFMKFFAKVQDGARWAASWGSDQLCIRARQKCKHQVHGEITFQIFILFLLWAMCIMETSGFGLRIYC